jgi:hypothetical protein
VCAQLSEAEAALAEAEADVRDEIVGEIQVGSSGHVLCSQACGVECWYHFSPFSVSDIQAAAYSVTYTVDIAWLQQPWAATMSTH